eukprot:6289881-Amphidinium_carterae.1
MDGMKIAFCVQIVGEARSSAYHQSLARHVPCGSFEHDESGLDCGSTLDTIASQSNSDDLRSVNRPFQDGADCQLSLQSGKQSSTLSLSNWTASLSSLSRVCSGTQTDMGLCRSVREASSQTDRERPPKLPSP